MLQIWGVCCCTRNRSICFQINLTRWLYPLFKQTYLLLAHKDLEQQYSKAVVLYTLCKGPPVPLRAGGMGQGSNMISRILSQRGEEGGCFHFLFSRRGFDILQCSRAWEHCTELPAPLRACFKCSIRKSIPHLPPLSDAVLGMVSLPLPLPQKDFTQGVKFPKILRITEFRGWIVIKKRIADMNFQWDVMSGVFFFAI